MIGVHHNREGPGATFSLHICRPEYLASTATTDVDRQLLLDLRLGVHHNSEKLGTSIYWLEYLASVESGIVEVHAAWLHEKLADFQTNCPTKQCLSHSGPF